MMKLDSPTEKVMWNNQMTVSDCVDGGGGGPSVLWILNQ